MTEDAIQRLLNYEPVTVRLGERAPHWQTNVPFTIQRYQHTRYSFLRAYRITRNGRTVRGYSEIKYDEQELRNWVSGLEEVQ